MSQPATYDGSCHCGAVTFRVRVEAHVVRECNCSVCRKKGIVHLIVPDEALTILSGADALTLYTFHTHTAKHMFCRTCGMHPFYRPRSYPDGWSVNLRCLDGDVWPNFEFREPFDGRNWERSFEAQRRDLPL